jgi:hypothetical protein
VNRAVKPPSTSHNNADLLVWACYSAGGFERWLDVEELYLKAFELGPRRLAWRTRPDIPDYKKCAKALQELEDPKRSDHLGLFLKNGRYSRKLSEAGLDWCTSNSAQLERLYGSGQVAPQLTSDSSRIVARLEKSAAFKQFSANEIDSIDTWLIAEAIECLPDSSPAVWSASFDRVQAAGVVCGRDDVCDFVKAARNRITTEGKQA